MKRYFALIIDFFCVLIFGSLFAIIFGILSFGSTHLVSGRTLSFSHDIFFYSALSMIPIVMICLPCCMQLYKTRHKKNPVGSFICYVVLNLFLWIALFPLQITISNNIKNKLGPISELTENEELSKGYFRQVDGETYYYLEDSVDKSAKVVTMDSHKSPESVPFFQDVDISEKIAPYADPLIKNAQSKSSRKLREILFNFNSFITKSWNNGFISWLCFLTFAFALGSVYAFIQFSDWRLINTYLCITLSFGVIYLNCIYFTPSFDHIRASLYEFFYGHGGFSHLVQREVDVPLCTINLLIGVIFTIIGIINSIINKKRNN